MSNLTIFELIIAGYVSKCWHDVIFGDNQACWKQHVSQWCFGNHIDKLQFGHAAWRERSIHRYVLNKMVIQACNAKKVIAGFSDIRVLDKFFKCLHAKMNDQIHVVKETCAFFSGTFTRIFENLLFLKNYYDYIPSEPQQIKLPIVFTGRFTQIFEMGVFGNSLESPNFCRSEWSFTLILENNSTSTGMCLAKSPISGAPMISKKREYVTAYCCWKKKSQISYPSLEELNRMVLNTPWIQQTVDWVAGLHIGVGKPTISIARGFIQPEDGMVYLKATGNTVSRTEDIPIYPNIPGRHGEFLFFIDSGLSHANGLFALDLAMPAEGPGFFFLNRCSNEEWMTSTLYNELPKLAQSFGHTCSLLSSIE